MSYEITAVNIIDVGIVGSIRLEVEKDHENAGTAVGFFFGLRSLLD